ncbi:MAG: EAL domain-containing protein [Acidimicrobiales bacterium]|jgi:diguanylate cyclase (GGDEF)-like protein
MNTRSMFDSTASTAQAMAGHEGEEQFRSLVLNIPGAVYRRECAEPWTMLFISDHIEVLTGYPATDFTRDNLRSFASIICVEDRGHVSEVVRDALGRDGSFSVEYRLVDAAGAYKWVVERGRSVAGPDGLPLWIDGVIFDLSAHKETEQLQGNTEVQAGRRLGHDALTCLPDRTLIRDRLQQVLLRSQRDHQLVAALLVDLDNFKSINDKLGQDAGDELLKAVAGRLMAVLRVSDTIGRPSGDEFAILADGLSLSGGPELLAERLLDTLKEPFRLEGFDDVPLSVTASIGIATNESDEPDDLLRDAAIALCQAKAQGRNCHVRFRPEMKSAAMERLELETDLREALQENQFFLVYQPVFELNSAGVWGAEAFLRWRHPVRGVVDPEYFGPVLANTEMIVPVGSWVLKQACRQAVAWHRLGHELTMSINVSTRQLEADDFVDQLRDILLATALEPASLIIDVAEPSLSSSTDSVARRFDELGELGVLVAVDGFGTGSSPAHLERLPLGALKIDRSFVAAMADSPEAISAIHTLLSLCRTLGIETFAEGIEQGWQLATLQKEQCRFGQGSLFSHPIAAEALEAILSLEGLFS